MVDAVDFVGVGGVTSASASPADLALGGQSRIGVAADGWSAKGRFFTPVFAGYADLAFTRDRIARYPSTAVPRAR